MQTGRMDYSQFANVLVVILYIVVKTKMDLSFLINNNVPSLGIREAPF